MVKFSFYVFTIALSLLTFSSFGQTIVIEYENLPLNEVLLDLNERYKIQISINSDLSSNCIINIRQEFASMEEALSTLADKCQLELKTINNVYIFRKKSTHPSVANNSNTKKEPKPKPKAKPVYLYQGQIVEQNSEEPLPFTAIQLNNKTVVADENGYFSFKLDRLSTKAKVYHLGYVISDTLLTPNYQIKIRLNPKNQELQEITVLENEFITTTHLGEKAGFMQINDINNRLMPGSSVNLIFNNLRLFPGIMASGEAIGDYVIWGSYSGQNNVIFDGITLFNSWGIQDDIGRINPFMVKNVSVHKGGYNVPHGDRVSGVVEIEGREGNRENFEANFGVNNQIANLYINVPLFQNSSSLQLSGRQSYYQFLNLSARPAIETDDSYILPEYDYRDFNLKFSTSINPNNLLEISTFISSDNYNGTLEAEQRDLEIQEINIQSIQLGSSLRYAKNWTNGGLSQFSYAQSYYEPQETTTFEYEEEVEGNDNLPPPPPNGGPSPPNGGNGPLPTMREVLFSSLSSSVIQEHSFNLSHQFPSKGIHQVQLNAGWVSNTASSEASNNGNELRGASKTLNRFTFFVHDRLQLTSWLDVEIGLKLDVPESTGEFYWQPRVNGTFHLTEHWNTNFGWGIYNQFVSQVAVYDEFENQTSVWRVNGDNVIPPLEASHYVLGLSYLSEKTEFNVEGYFKNTTRVGRYLARGLQPSQPPRFVTGKSWVQGLDFFFKQRFHKQELWLSYSLSEVTEEFLRGRQLAPQNQSQELKAALSLDFNPFYLTFTQAYGSGFRNTLEIDSEIVPYWRTDIALQYHFTVKNTYFETGLSILNLFNRQNIRLNQAVSVPNGAVINTIGIPFTPTFYLNGYF